MQPPAGDYTGIAALVAALSANVTALFKGRGISKHSVNNAINAAVGPVASRVAVVEKEQTGMAGRLDRLEDTIQQNHRDVMRVLLERDR